MTRKQKFDFFKKEVFRFIDFFGLNFWEIEIDEFDDRSDEHSAGCDIDFNNPEGDGKQALIYITKSFLNNDLAKDEITRAAFHEVCELLLIKMRDYFMIEKINKKTRKIELREFDDAVHVVIRILENKVLPLIPKKNKLR
jgi:hypothetical protein